MCQPHISPSVPPAGWRSPDSGGAELLETLPERPGQLRRALLRVEPGAAGDEALLGAGVLPALHAVPSHELHCTNLGLLAEPPSLRSEIPLLRHNVICCQI